MAINDPSKIIFSTRYNFQKIYLNDSATLTLASSITPQEYTLVVHGLGYVPTVRIFYVPVSGQLWPLSPRQYSNLDGGSGTPLDYYGSPVITTNEVKVRMTNSSGGDADILFYYRVYLDE